MSRVLARAFSPRAVAGLEDQIGGHARRCVDRMLTGAAVCDFATDIASDLPLLTLADTLGVPPQDRMLLFDWSKRVIGFRTRTTPPVLAVRRGRQPDAAQRPSRRDGCHG